MLSVTSINRHIAGGRVKLSCLFLFVVLWAGLGAKSNWSPSFSFDNNMLFPQNSFLHSYYPVLPGDKDWRKLTRLKEMLPTLQLSEEKLAAISDSELVQVCLFSPYVFIYRMGAYPVKSIKKVQVLNCYQEILKRPSAAAAIAERYLQSDYVPISRLKKSKDKAEKSLGVQLEMALFANEYLLTRQEVLSNLDEKQLAQLMHKGLAESHMYSHEKQTYNMKFHLNQVCLMMGRIMQCAQYEPFVQDLAGIDGLERFGYHYYFRPHIWVSREYIIAKAIEYENSH